MSFSEDPYKHMTVGIKSDDTFTWECDSCGAESSRGNKSREAETFHPSTSIAVIKRAFHRHVRISHDLQPSDTLDWS